MAKADNGQHFEVHCSGAVASDLYQLQDQAGADLKKRIAAAFKKIVRKLQVDAEFARTGRWYSSRVVGYSPAHDACPNLPLPISIAFSLPAIVSIFSPGGKLPG
jgi:hypothetical protein